MSLFKIFSAAAAALALAPSATALAFEKANYAEVTLDLETRHEVPVPGGVKLGK